MGYIVLSEGGIGYLVYKDDETELTCRQIKIVYTPSEENENKYEYVDMVDGKGEDWKYGIHSRDRTLSIYLPAIDLGILQRNYSENIVYKRVDRAQDLSYVEKKLGKLQYATFENYRYDGTYSVSLSNSEYDEYIARYVIYDALSGKATLKYALKSEGVAKERAIDFTLNNNDTLTIDGKVYSAGLYIDRDVTVTTEYGDVLLLESLYMVSGDIDEILARDIENYNSQLQEQEPAEQ